MRFIVAKMFQCDVLINNELLISFFITLQIDKQLFVAHAFHGLRSGEYCKFY